MLERRTQLVAQKITQFLKETNRFDKTIVFCEDIEHAARMRQALINENGDLISKNSKYVMQITGDNPEGKAELDNFIMPESRYPVIVTTSKLMTTGVDAQTCKLIVLDQRIESLSQFKQIIGRGTRIREDFDKFFFTIMDFKKATELFADPDFDGEPVQVYQPGPVIRLSRRMKAPDETIETTLEEKTRMNRMMSLLAARKQGRRKKYYVGDVAVFVVSERVQYLRQ